MACADVEHKVAEVIGDDSTGLLTGALGGRFEFPGVVEDVVAGLLGRLR